MSNKRLVGLWLATTFQLLIFFGMYVNAAMPMWTGVEVKLKTVPVDPRSMFRGNYARLRYDISRIDQDHLTAIEQDNMRNGEVVYISLEPGVNDLYEFSSASLQQPDSGVFIRGRIESEYGEVYRVNYGIEAFFAPKQEALDLEKRLRKGATAVLMVSADGKAGIKAVIASP